MSNVETQEYLDMDAEGKVASMEVTEQAVAELVKGKPFPCPKLQPNATKIADTKSPKKSGTDEEPMFASVSRTRFFMSYSKKDS